MYAMLGDEARAMSNLERAFEEREPGALFVGRDQRTAPSGSHLQGELKLHLARGAQRLELLEFVVVPLQELLRHIALGCDAGRTLSGGARELHQDHRRLPVGVKDLGARLVRAIDELGQLLHSSA